MRFWQTSLVLGLVFTFAAPDPAFAYVGPGTGLAIIGAALAFVASVFLGILGFVWYPFKRAYRALFGGDDAPADEAAE